MLAVRLQILDIDSELGSIDENNYIIVEDEAESTWDNIQDTMDMDLYTLYSDCSVGVDFILDISGEPGVEVLPLTRQRVLVRDILDGKFIAWSKLEENFPNLYRELKLLPTKVEGI